MNTFAFEMANFALSYFSLRNVTVGNAAIMTSEFFQSMDVRHAADRLVETEGFSTAQVFTDGILCIFINAVCTQWVPCSRVK